MEFQKGDRVKPVSKTVGIHGLLNSYTYKLMKAQSQDFLYVVALDQEESIRKGQNVYFCSLTLDNDTWNSDLYTEYDLQMFQ